MMWFAHGDLGWAGWTVMITSMVLFWGLFIWGISLLFRLGAGRDNAPTQQGPERVLAHRFALGEIDADAYNRALDVLADRGVGGAAARR